MLRFDFMPVDRLTGVMAGFSCTIKFWTQSFDRCGLVSERRRS
jgi:hypothetical protein